MKQFFPFTIWQAAETILLSALVSIAVSLGLRSQFPSNPSNKWTYEHLQGGILLRMNSNGDTEKYYESYGWVKVPTAGE